MRSVIGEVETVPYLYPKLMVDEDGDVWFMIKEGEGFVVKYREDDELMYIDKYERRHGPLKDFHGTITLSNS